MTHNKRSKNSRQRASWTHGWGAKKKHRGAGHRGGRGKAGSGKKGDAKKTRYWKNKDYFGKIGFSSINATNTKTINITQLQSKLLKLEEKGIITKKADTYVLDLKKFKIDKLLGTGKATKKMEITVQEASEAAIKKIQDAGGKVNLPANEKQEA